MGRHLAKILLTKILLIAAFALPCTAKLAWAADSYGQITFGGLPVPGATVVLSQGEKKLSTTSDEGGVYHFAELADGTWKIQISLQCFTTIEADVTVGPDAVPGKWELKLLPAEELKSLAQGPPVQIESHGKDQAPRELKKKADAAANMPVEIPKAPEQADQDSSDGLLVNGSVNNAATSQFSMNQAFGNGRANSKSLYNGGFAVILDNSAIDARQYSLSGFNSPQPAYDRITAGFTLGGPLNIPHLMPRGPMFFAAYQITRNHTADTESALVPTEAERSGDLQNAAGQPGSILDPATGLPFPNSMVPVSSQALALLQLYPLPNVSGNPIYNFQIPVLNSSHQDIVQSRLDKTLGHRDEVYGTFNLRSTRADAVNLFRFVDTTDMVGMNTNINWSHRFNQGLFLYASYHFSRLRTLVRPEFENRQNISGEAGISGNNQDPQNWGPPALNFSSGIAALSDAESAFNRNRTDGFSGSMGLYRGHHNITLGGDLRKQQYNQDFQQDPRGTFTFNGAATGSDLADFLIGVPDASSVAFGNADKYLRQTVYDAYANDDWRVLPILTINAGVRWEFGAPMTELYGRLVNLDIAPGFKSAAPVLGTDPTGPITGQHYPRSLVHADITGIEPRIGISWRPVPASTIVVRAGYGTYHDTSVYLAPVLQLAQQAPLSTTVKQQNGPACPLTLGDAFTPCNAALTNTFALDKNFRVGYAQTWHLSVQRDLPFALQGTVTYRGVKGTHGVQQFLPNSYPVGGNNPCGSCPSGFVYETSGGNSNRQSAQVQLRRRLRGGFAASLLYTYSKSIDDDATLGGQGYVSDTSQQSETSENTLMTQAATTPSPAITQDWLDPGAERSLSSFDQRHLLNLQAQYTTGQGLEGGTLLGGWPGRLLKEWTVLMRTTAGTGMPETPIYPAVVPGTGWVGPLRPDRTGAPIYQAQNGDHLTASAFAAPAAGTWGNAGRNSITGPNEFSLDGALQRSFRTGKHFFLDARIDATNVLNHPTLASWNTTIGNTQFGRPVSVNPMRSLETTLRLRF